MKDWLKYILFVLVCTLIAGIAFTSSDFFTAPFLNMKDGLILFFQWCVLMLAMTSVVYLLSLNKYVFAVFYPLIFFFSAILTYFRYTTGTTFTTMILDAALDNDTQITLELINSGLILIILISLVISILLVVYRFREITISRPWLNFCIAIVLFLIIFNIPRIKGPVQERIPFNLYFTTVRYFSEKQEALSERHPFPKPAFSNDEDLTVLFIMGESLRADHLGLNGYERNTTPLLSQEDIISFPHIYSPYTHTNPSVAYIMTRADSLHTERAYTERSFIDLFRQSGFYTAWLANQEPAKAYVYFMYESDTLLYGNRNKSVYVFDKWVDEELLPPFRDILAQEKKNKMIIMHTIGSHWYYNSHFTDEYQQYNPVTSSRVVSSNTAEEMINSYDNTILYTDYFICQTIEALRDKNAVLIYLSDHGEALGEDGVWLHAAESEMLHKPACFLWLSDLYKELHPGKEDALVKNKDKRYGTDFLFHTILDAAGIESELFRAEQSLFRD